MYKYKVIADNEILLATHTSNNKLDYKATLKAFYEKYPMFAKIEIVYCGYIRYTDIHYLTLKR